MGVGVRGSLKKEGIYVYIQRIHVVVQQKRTQCCKATTLQLKNKEQKEKLTGKIYSGILYHLDIPQFFDCLEEGGW